MKEVFTLLWMMLFTVNLVFAQKKDTVSLHCEDLPLEIILDSISYKTGYFFSYNADAIPEGSLYTIKKQDILIDSLLAYILVGTGLTFNKSDDQIVLRPDEQYAAVAKAKDHIEITGWVREFETKKAIPSVNVYLNGTTIGTTTDENGKYWLTNVPRGSYEIIFSHIGYEIGTSDLVISENKHYSVNGLLGQKINTLQAVTVESEPLFTPQERSRFIKSFNKEFLGSSVTAAKCEIENDSILIFYYSEALDILHAEAIAPLIITNKSLGYQISYDLEHFEKSADQVNFYGKARFIPMIPENKREKRRWEFNRKKSYKGSILHFSRSLIQNELEREGFKLYQLETLGNFDLSAMPSLSRDDIVFSHEEDFEWKIRFDNYVLVNYLNEIESAKYLNDRDKSSENIFGLTLLSNNKPTSQRSVIELNQESVTIDQYGQIKEQLGMSVYGYWAWERVGDLIPVNYVPR